MVSDQQWSKVVDGLLRRTNEGQVRWQEGAGLGEYVAVLEDQAISIQRITIGERDNIRLQLVNAAGNVVAAHSAGLEQGEPAIRSADDWAPLLALWESARESTYDAKGELRKLAERLGV